MTPLEAVARLRAVVERMAPTPWDGEDPTQFGDAPETGGCRSIGFHDGEFWHEVFCTCGLPDDAEDQANAVGILALRNLAGPLLAVVEAAAKDHGPARCGKLREAVGLPPGRCRECEALTALARAVEEPHGD